MEGQELSHSGAKERVLEVSDLCVQTDAGVDIVEDVGFVLRSGQVLGVVGESGSGKTTTALALLGHTRGGTRIASGSVLLNGKDVLKLDKNAMRRVRGRDISYVPQDPTASLSPRQRIGSQLLEVFEVHGDKRARHETKLCSLLERVDLPTTNDFLRRFPFELSGGQQQRVAIAMALVWKPSVVVLDEPTTGLDVTTQAKVLELLQELSRDSGAAFVYVTHDLAVVDMLADHVVVMYSGRIVEFGRRQDVFSTPAHPYTSMLLSAVPRLAVRLKLKGTEKGAPPPGSRPTGCAFVLRCGYASEPCGREFPGITHLSVDGGVRCFNPLVSPTISRDPNRPPWLTQLRLTTKPLQGLRERSWSRCATLWPHMDGATRNMPCCTASLCRSPRVRA